jgi:hypothetical protein
MAVNAAAWLDRPEALRTLRELVKYSGPCSERVRSLAVMALSALNGDDAARLLIEIATTDPSTTVRTIAYAVSAQLSAPAIVPLLDSVVTGRNTDPHSRDQAFAALAARRESAAEATVRRIAENDAVPAELRRRAAQLHAPGIATSEESFIRNFMTSVKSEAAQRAARAALEDRSGKTALEFLVAHALTPDPAYDEASRRAALQAIPGRHLTAADLLSLYDRTEGLPGVQLYLINRMAERRDPVLMDRLLAVAKQGPTSLSGRHAIAVLSTTGDPRVAGLLLEIVNNPPDVRR